MTNMPQTQTLSKSSFVHCLECPTKLYYKLRPKTYKSLNDDNEFLAALAEGGIQVGELAKLYYPEGVEIPFQRDDKSAMLRQTAEVMASGDCVIFEAAFQVERAFALVDILRVKGSTVEVIEVKSKSYSEETQFLGKREPHYVTSEWQKYLFDVAFQTWIVRKCLPNHHVVAKLSLADKDSVSTMDRVHQHFRVSEDESGRKQVIPTQEARQHPDVLGAKLLKEVDVTHMVDDILEGKGRKPKLALESEGFDAWVLGLSDAVANGTKIEPVIGQACKGCEYRVPRAKLDGLKSGFEECWSQKLGWKEQDFEDPLAMEIGQWRKEVGAQDVYKMKEVTGALIGLEQDVEADPEALYSMIQWDKTGYRQAAQAYQLTGRHPEREVLMDGFDHEMESWRWPLTFIDFEGVRPAIPFHKGMRPYQQIPFQFSVHVLHKDGGVEHTAEWLEGQPGRNPLLGFAESLRDALTDTPENPIGTIFIYSKYERTMMKDVVEVLRDTGQGDEALHEWIDRFIQDVDEKIIVDQHDLVKAYYFSPIMGGRTSIKVVLPAVLHHSEFLKQAYAEPYSGLSIQGMPLLEPRPDGKIDPYYHLKQIDAEIPDPSTADEDETVAGVSIADGGAAMMAWARMQFDDVDPARRRATFDALLRYCELDTLAMVLIMQHWLSLRGKM